MQLVLHNIDQVLTGVLDAPMLDTDTIVVDGGRIVSLDAGAATTADVVVDCKQMTVAPGLVDTHVHPTLGDYAPKQQSSGYLERMMHGAVTRAISAGEVHAPGRSGAESALGIALGAFHSFDRHRPSGMKVHGGAMLLEKDTDTSHIDRAYAAGMRIIGEIGVGSLKDPVRAGELSLYARELGMTVHMHCGCTSDRGPGGDEHPYFSAEDVMEARPSIASHANTFASLSDADIDMLCEDGGPPYVEVVQAGGTRSMLRVVEGLAERDRLDRLLIGTDTPTGYGVTSLGILKTIGDVCSLGGVAPETAWAIASGHAAAAFGSDGNVIRVGAVADLVVMDASLGSVWDTAVEGIAAGEFPGVAVVITDGAIRVRGSLCTLRARRVAGITG
ncbi:MAG: amidohydrolase family protein [Acidimicrobiaceae bacterium]|nr:amidohydrolase family protein [Acidimicrobiaceae bacterium]